MLHRMKHRCCGGLVVLAAALAAHTSLGGSPAAPHPRRPLGPRTTTTTTTTTRGSALRALTARPTTSATVARGDRRRVLLHERCLVVRGGARDDEEEPPKENPIVKALEQLPPCVRAHVVGVAIATLVAMSGVVDPEKSFGLDHLSTIFRFQVWRPFSSACFLGTPSMASATSLYLLIKYGCELELAVGTEAYAKFLIFEVLLLCVTASMIGLPIIANALVTAVIYAASRLQPFADIQFQFGIKLKYWMLPFGLMVIEMLQKQSVAAVVPHVLGCLCAHVHHFFSVVWPTISAASTPTTETLSPRAKASPLAPASAGGGGGLAAKRVGRKLGGGGK